MFNGEETGRKILQHLENVKPELSRNFAGKHVAVSNLGVLAIGSQEDVTNFTINLMRKREDIFACMTKEIESD